MPLVSKVAGSSPGVGAVHSNRQSYISLFVNSHRFKCLLHVSFFLETVNMLVVLDVNLLAISQS